MAMCVRGIRTRLNLQKPLSWAQPCPHGTWKSKSKEIGNCVWHGAMTELLIIVANLWTDISNLHTRHWLVRLQVTDLDHEVVNAQVPSIHNQTCIDNGIVGSPDKL